MIEYTKIAHLQYPRHNAYAYQIKGSSYIHCIRYTSRGIEWDWFNDWDTCKDTMVEEPSAWKWGFTEDPEPDSEG